MIGETGPDHHPAGPAEERVLVVIPAWNEELSIGAVLEEVDRALPGVSVLVVDDHSRDRTGAIAREAGAQVITNVFNLGVGGAMRVGFRFAAERGYTSLIQIDADGQHDAADAPLLLKSLGYSLKPVIVIGARFHSSEDFPVHRPRRWAMRLLAHYLSRVTGTRLTDVTSGYRAYNRAAIELFARTYPSDYLADTVESLMIASHHGALITQVSTTMRPRRAGVPSQSRSRSILYLSRVVLMLVLESIRPKIGPFSKEEK